MRPAIVQTVSVGYQKYRQLIWNFYMAGHTALFGTANFVVNFLVMIVAFSISTQLLNAVHDLPVSRRTHVYPQISSNCLSLVASISV